MARNNLLIYLMRRDLRVSDNPILHRLATSKEHNFTHLLPVFVFPSKQIEVSGFLPEGIKSPYPEARSQVGNFWRCGPHRARFLAQSVWDVKQSLESLDSGLLIRVGSFQDVLDSTIKSLTKCGVHVSAVWMTEEHSFEEIEEQETVSSVCSDHGVDFRLWPDEKYFVDDRDTGLAHPRDLPDVFTTYRKSQEPLRDQPRSTLPKPRMSTLPPFLDAHAVPSQFPPFVAAKSLAELESRLVSPIATMFHDQPPFPEGAQSAHPFTGGETEAWRRLEYLIKTGAMTAYKSTRNGLIGPDFSTKLSAYLSNGSLTARQIHHELVRFENGTYSKYVMATGYGEGENDGTRAVRFELLWRDYMRLCTQKFGRRLFRLSGLRETAYKRTWKSGNAEHAAADQDPSPERVSHIIERFLQGTTGMGLIDASQRELFHTGYTSNRARQNVASFLAKHLEIDWRYGAEWYEMMLVDYDVSSNWSNWMYVAGVGNDPRGEARIFNPVKQAYDYDREGEYVRMWVPEVRTMEKIENVFQICTASPDDLERFGLTSHIMVTDPIKKIDFSVDKKPRTSRKPTPKWRLRDSQARKDKDNDNEKDGDGNWRSSDTTVVIRKQSNNNQAGANDPGKANDDSRATIPHGAAGGNMNRASGTNRSLGTNGVTVANSASSLTRVRRPSEANGSNGFHGTHGLHTTNQTTIMGQYQHYPFHDQLNGISLSPPGFVMPMYYPSSTPFDHSPFGNSQWFQATNTYRQSRGRGSGQGYRGRGGRRGGQRYNGRNNSFRRDNNNGPRHGGHFDGATLTSVNNQFYESST
ncbi:unnamed protein product [Clonostachys rosea f. rosea IK726]|uniref:Photolyase/cryptochrome alpha/beta domain-containing protein n=2 Tax=Bionectria ochroleuca TaxID=29856 RepID=A0A0B7K0C3_BIOOC|nr:unnamed protein product [Clonostachys rosea f. rosea IK726]